MLCMGIKKHSPIDNIIGEIEYALECILNQNNLPRKSDENKSILTKKEAAMSEKVMRINHMGEICAQGLYRGQAAHTKDTDIKSKLYIICEEENEHLKLCNLRLKELDGRPSILNPLWYFSSYILGSIAGMKDADWKLGFIEETEKQVKEHLKESILQLPENDHRSKDFLKQIAKDEEKHKVTVQDIGSNDIPDIIKRGMHVSSKIMKKLTSLI